MASHTVVLGSDLAARAAARGARERPWLQSKPVKGKLATICQTREENVGDSPGNRVKAAQSTSLPMLPISKSTEPIDRQSKFQRSPRNRVKAAEPVTAALGKPIGRCSPTSLTTTRRPEDGFKAASQSKIPVLSDSRMAAPNVRCSVAVTSRKSALKTAKGPSKTVHWSETVESKWFDIHESAATIKDNVLRLVPHSPNVNTRACGWYSEHGWKTSLSAAYSWKFSNQAIKQREALDGLSVVEEGETLMASLRARGRPSRRRQFS